MTKEKDESEGADEKSGLKPAKIAASALAAVTAAFLGSTLGVAGTVAGAGIASVITTVGAEVYLRSLRKTQAAARRTKEAITPTAIAPRPRVRRAEPSRAQPVNPLLRRNNPTARPFPGSDPTAHARPDNDRTVYLNRADSPTMRVNAGDGPTVHLPRPDLRTTHLGAAEETVVVPQPGATKPKAKGPWWKSRWTIAAGVSAFAFVVSMLLITGFETATGRTLSGDPGTTLGRLTGGGAPIESPEKPAPTQSSTTAPPTTVTETPASSQSSAPQRNPASSSTAPSRPSAPASSSAPPSEPSTQSPSPSPTPTRAFGDAPPLDQNR
ncbi:hypothetical protein [Amycolatopsis taiwanensis]|uniref:hypothetical protein n=1 Tax=Amycolatopsis taiwanensis TaxID=342230 RepID=UPI0004B7AF49|nr:hypothetical protein [Amycolatopsis taiwanensis]